MTTREWNEGIEYLKSAEYGDCVEHEGRRVEVGNMIGGRFELYDDEGFCGIVEEEWRAMEFLRFGRF